MTKFPRAWVAANAAVQRKLEAKIDMSAEVAGKGLCPDCKKPMTEAYAGEHKVWACAADRIVLPFPDESK
jgi:hypothetical protein